MAFIKTDITKIGDPFVLEDNGKYYLYATSSKDGFKVWSSDNLNKWNDCGLCYYKEKSLGFKEFWAPEVVKHKNKYIMHYTANYKIRGLRTGVAVSESPLGPFIDVYDGPMFELGFNTIDASCFIDDDGKAYLYYSKDCSTNIINGVNTSQIFCVKLSDDLLSVKGEHVLCTTPDNKWETFSDSKWHWNEGPFVIKHNNEYHLCYSTNFFKSKFYSVCCAKSDSPFGPFIKYENNPILKYKENEFSGPGHNMLFKFKVKLMNAFHIHTDYKNPSGDRTVCFCDAEFKDGKLSFKL